MRPSSDIIGPEYIERLARDVWHKFDPFTIRNLVIDMGYKPILRSALLAYWGPPYEFSYYFNILHSCAPSIFFPKILFSETIKDYPGLTNFLKQNPYKVSHSEYPLTMVGMDGEYGKCKTTIFYDPNDPRKEPIHFYYSITIPNMASNYFHTAAVKRAKSRAVSDEKDTEVIEYRVRFGTSVDSIKAKMIRELDDDVDTDDVEFLIEPIF